MRKNPFTSIYEVCNQGNSIQKLDNLPEFPRYIDIELTNHCNFRCLMCPTGTKSIKRKSGYLSMELFSIIINEIKEYKTPIRFIRWGEPTLHPEWLNCIRKAHNEGIVCHLNTNGSKLNEAIIDEIIKIPLDSIKFSFQGVDKKSYKEMRCNDDFEELMKKVELLHTKRADKLYPYIHISTTITYETKEQVESFKNNVKQFTDLVTVGRTVLEHIDINKVNLAKKEKELLLWLKTQESVIKKHTECPEVFDKLSINWDGSVSACCSDYDNKMIVGDLSQNSLKEIWNSEKMNIYRKLLAEMRHDSLELCKSCYDYHSLQLPGLQFT